MAHTGSNALRWLLGALGDGVMAVSYIVITVPVALLGIASAFGLAASVGLSALNHSLGPRLTVGCFVLLVTCSGVLALQDWLYRRTERTMDEQ